MVAPFILYLKSLAARARWRIGPFRPPPDDPPAGVRHPRSRVPGGRSSAAAVSEPDDWDDVDACAPASRARRER
jgi:hypothetical protein